MRLLVIGGTRFLGRHLISQALARGHEVTLFHRGQSGPGLFPAARTLIGDRNADLAALQGGPWDAVVDTCAYVPRHVRTMAAALAGRAGRYLLVSTISVYPEGAAAPDETTPPVTLPDPTVETVSGETYGGLKALCEAALRAAMPEAALIARPGLIVGPWDPTGRFTWWVQRIARGGDVLAPGDPAAPVQFIDVRDAAAWLLRQAEAGTTGTFNLTGPAEPLTMQAFLQAATQALASNAHLHWRDEATLLARGATPWTEIPLWVPAADAGLHRTRIDRALATGLSFTPLADTIRDTATWAAEHDTAHNGIGLSANKEKALLA